MSNILLALKQIKEKILRAEPVNNEIFLQEKRKEKYAQDLYFQQMVTSNKLKLKSYKNKIFKLDVGGEEVVFSEFILLNCVFQIRINLITDSIFIDFNSNYFKLFLTLVRVFQKDEKHNQIFTIDNQFEVKLDKTIDEKVMWEMLKILIIDFEFLVSVIKITKFTYEDQIVVENQPQNLLQGNNNNNNYNYQNARYNYNYDNNNNNYNNDPRYNYNY